MTYKRKNLLAAVLFLLPFTVFYTIFTIWPIIQGLYVSLHKWGLMGKQRFVGLKNYQKFLGDRYFWEALGNTTKFVVLTVPVLMVLALLLALLANRNSRGRKFFRVAYYLPNVLSVTVVSYCALFMFKPYLGFVNSFLKTIGVLQPAEEIFWLSEGQRPWFVVVAATVWWTVGYSMMLYLSALKDIPGQLYEAAAMDGATDVKAFFYITIPMLTRTTYLIFMLQVIASFKVFGQFWLITKGGPGTSTRPLIQLIYQTGFEKNNMGYASAMSFALFLILLVLTVAQLSVQRRGER